MHGLRGGGWGMGDVCVCVCAFGGEGVSGFEVKYVAGVT